MEKSKLINLWIAQGFIMLSNQNGQCLEDVGHEYFMDLLWRSFFQEAKMDDLGNVISCKMHDLMHDLAMSRAGPLITRLESKEKIIIDQKTRHVAVVDNIDISFVNPTSSSKVSRIRTLLSVGEWKDLQESSTSCEAIFSSLKFLRVLDLHERPLDVVPSFICKLKHLRDLDLSGNDKIEKLPDSIIRLQNLHTLGISGCKGIKELPRGITKLVNLRHLYNDGCENLTCMPRGLGELKNLQTLSKFVVHSDSTPNDSGQLSELNRLTSLRGALEISGLRSREEDVANLKERGHLQVLTLHWERENVINALERFEPHPNLKKLNIYEYGGVRFPMWLLSLTNLVHLSLRGCNNLKYLPPLSGLPFLKRISLFFLFEIEYVSDCSDNNELSLSSFSLSEFFPSLESIFLGHCPNLKGWWRSDSYNVDVNTTTDHQNSFETPSSMTRRNALLFPRLSNLHIFCCPLLTSLPMFPHLEEGLYLMKARWKAVQQTISTNASSSASSTPIAFSSPPLSKLKNISLDQLEDLETLPVDGLQNLISLQRLRIAECPKLKSLSQGIQYLTAIQILKLIDCPMLDLGNDEHGMQWKGLKSLISLEFDSIPKLVSLPLGLQHVTTLQHLRISNCSSLMTIPEWICNWASLEQFTISTCPGLTSLPEAMSRLTSLKVLTIDDCPILLQRCKQDGGEDWPKIAHIPKLEYFDPQLQYD
ncbi:putative disease resistance protein RGA1 isoform X1 [Juglans regia]|uniref:Disease resistance protein RGA1 isoform X1 n=1 Tax=Juglans regia TaxID=51240 RepID=A0A6P9E1B6_JUGRE|nr:putative disease resistance protein RGA1 isoform X1 [Juglans regia]XP_035541294.1 putative disease resistance protein RGA1 isoform X1 [Juglans regia]XP_035541295.1 putative disease resistance protein RGA1 isoform X1 [Juglans regia]